jgi:signal peptidase complex subunit 2
MKLSFYPTDDEFAQILTEKLTASTSTIPSTPTDAPKFSLELVYLHSANGGKTLLKRSRETGQVGYNAFFDEDGHMDVAVFERWIDSLVAKATATS